MSIETTPLIVESSNPRSADFWLSRDNCGQKIAGYTFTVLAPEQPQNRYEIITERSQIFKNHPSSFVCKDNYSDKWVTFKGSTRNLAFPRTDEDYTDQESWRHPLRQAAILSQLDHPNIPKFIDLVRITKPHIPPNADYGKMSQIFVVTEYFPQAKTLEQYIKRCPDITSVAKIILEIGNTLCYLNSKRIIHGDINPSNILILPDGSIKIIDFELSQQLESNKKKIKDEYLAVGNLKFSSQEQCVGIYTLKSDVYSLAQTCLCILQKISTDGFKEHGPSIIHPDYADALIKAGICPNKLEVLLDQCRNDLKHRPSMPNFYSRLQTILSPLCQG